MTAVEPGFGADIRTLTVVGAGLVGGSVCLAARSAGIDRVVVTDRDPDVRRRARALDLADVVADDLEGAVTEADLILVATPGAAVAEVVGAAARHAPADAILTDVASLKSSLTLEVESRLREEVATGRSRVGASRFVGGHPMAGSERSGPEAADAQLFVGATWVLTPTSTTDDAVLERLGAFLRRLGARVLALPPERHDELVAVVSHLPQVVASTLAWVAADTAEVTGEALLAVAGGGFRDTTRIAASDPGLWVGILEGNRAAVLEAVDMFRARLDELRAALDAEDWGTLAARLEAASAARRRLVPKADEVPAVDLVVGLDDRPGALAMVATALGEAGVNVEDLALRHAPAGERGALLVRVAAGDAERALQALADRRLTGHVEDVEAQA